MGKFFKFEKMITPIFIQIIFWVGLIGSIIAGIGQIGFSFIIDSGKFLYIITGFLTMFIGPIILRVYCEMLIVVFKMQDALIDIRDSLNQQVLQMKKRAQLQPQQPEIQTDVVDQMEYSDD